ncbi:MAG: glycosyltransferase [Acidobacteriota bacterium]
MIYYFLPDRGRFGGVKVGAQLVEMLVGAGAPAVLALPGGRAPQWFRLSAPVIDDAEARAAASENDWIALNWPPDYQRLAGLPGRRLVHCQGTDLRMDPILADPGVLVLTCWPQASRYVRERSGREPFEIGLAVSRCFTYDGAAKAENLVAYMPRRGYRIARACMRSCPHLDFAPIDELDEEEVAGVMKSAGFYLATSVGEQFGLPALEAMAAGCVVASVPVRGGTDYLEDGCNCVVAAPEALPAALRSLSSRDASRRRARLRAAALATAARFHPALIRRRLAALLERELKELAA